MIERLYIQNFRCLENITLDFAGRPSALILGKNGSGKSTIRHAIAIFQSICRGSSRVGSLILMSDFAFHHVDRPMRFEIEVTLSGKRFKYAVSFDWPDNFREARVLDESLAVDGQDIFHSTTWPDSPRGRCELRSRLARLRAAGHQRTAARARDSGSQGIPRINGLDCST